ncbi:RNA pseudouridine synthase [Oleispira antarctica]|uniref:RNA pseudouridine synthase n=1 Tax=Oleispira antarctica TaxID=188908 RepID=A0A1Y5HZT9_OLEAN|nr:RNA pseudouridine synthase [Oleispira antarctica]
MTNINPDDFIAPRCDEEIEILFQDEHILLINKPTKLLSLSGKNPANLDSVHYRIRQIFPTALMIHRLDLGTSGIMVIALNKDISRLLNRQFSERQVNKTYTALLAGQLEQSHGKIELAIAKGEFPYQKICSDTGKAALTEYQCLGHEVFSHDSKKHKISRVQFKPHTGRTHQLRIHSQQLGHSIIGCDLYPNSNDCPDGNTELMANRLMLHATRLEFNHPISGERILATCDCPF